MLFFFACYLFLTFFVVVTCCSVIKVAVERTVVVLAYIFDGVEIVIGLKVLVCVFVVVSAAEVKMVMVVV